ncbi:MAG TPA: hypothetical protein VJS13_15945 [Pyrinomonadaceae bacterium]|nr:hypothetical protein [Pyrinomonadaceae bacterium]
MEEYIRANAEMVVQELRPLSGIDFGYTHESVKWLEGYIERLRTSGEFDDVETKHKLMSVFGSFLGECMVRCYGGTWKEHGEGDWGVAFANGTMAFPFGRVRKQMDDGLSEGITSFFSAIPAILNHSSSVVAVTPKKPWWKVW